MHRNPGEERYGRASIKAHAILGEGGSRVHEWMHRLEARRKRQSVGCSLEIHLAPVLLGLGVRPFDRVEAGKVSLVPERVVESPAVTHVRHRVRPGGLRRFSVE
jgi:hypothetical protein